MTSSPSRPSLSPSRKPIPVFFPSTDSLPLIHTSILFAPQATFLLPCGSLNQYLEASAVPSSPKGHYIQNRKMEGYLQVPPERNLIGSRGAWKTRYVVFGRDTLRAFPSSPPNFFLSIYKSKSESEPVAKYPIQDITSCYVGDLGIKQKKQVIMPTLIIHLRPDNHHVTSPRSFRRRSHENPNATRPAPTALFFRPGADTADSLQQWAREIQSYLYACAPPSSYNTTPITPTQHAFPDIAETSSSLFLVNGEPNTALLSPSLRSKCSDLSSIPSDRRSISSSSISELPSPKLDEHTQEHHGRTTFHIATNSEEFDPHEYDIRGHTVSGTSDSKRLGRRETILDRYFSSYAMTSPIDTPRASSIARFEALMTKIESQNPANYRKNSLISLGESSIRDMDIPKRIPSPTLRALEFVSTGVYFPEEGTQNSSVHQSLPLPDGYRPQSGGVYSNYSQSRRNSDSSIGAQSVAASSITGGGASSVVGSLSEYGQLSCASPSSKRHSIGDFPMRITTGSGFTSAMTAVGAGGSGMARPDSISEFTHDFNDEATLAKLAQAHKFHSRNNKPPPASPGPFSREFYFNER
ncbi:hypothetical protein BGX38DRAFT_1159288 [Terfezia claveryi]|nr:hypothetical protein BGX38DRAFT_1159288 [Terfezia claveryi]